jgi:hypothetical protein
MEESRLKGSPRKAPFYNSFDLRKKNSIDDFVYSPEPGKKRNEILVTPSQNFLFVEGTQNPSRETDESFGSKATEFLFCKKYN